MVNAKRNLTNDAIVAESRINRLYAGRRMETRE